MEIRRAKDQAVSKGVSLKRPYGYTKKGEKDTTPVIDHLHGPKVVLSFGTFLFSALTMRVVGKATGKDIGWLIERSPRSTINMLHNPYYIGAQRWKKVLVKNHHEAIISEEIFDAVQKLFTLRARKYLREDLIMQRRSQLQSFYSGHLYAVKQWLKTPPEKREKDLVTLLSLSAAIEYINTFGTPAWEEKYGS